MGAPSRSADDVPGAVVPEASPTPGPTTPGAGPEPGVIDLRDGAGPSVAEPTLPGFGPPPADGTSTRERDGMTGPTDHEGDATPPADDEPSGEAPATPSGATAGGELPHWTEPPTPDAEGEAGDAPVVETARWQDARTGYTDPDAVPLRTSGDDRPLGALDEDRPLDEAYLTFEDLEVPTAAAPKAPPRGTADDPIRRQRNGGVAPPVPVADAGTTGTTGDAGPAADGDPDGDPPTDTPPARSGGRDLRQSVLVGLGIAGTCLAVFLVAGFTELRWVPLLLVVPIIVASTAELFNATVRAGFRPINLVGLAAGAALPIVAYLGGTPAEPAGEAGMMLVLFLTLFASMAWYLFGIGKGRPLPNIAVTLLGVTYVGAMGAYGGMILRAGPWPTGSGPDVHQGVPLFVLIAFGTTMYDVGGYLLGSRLGRTPLSAASPNKTREGLAAGVLCSVGITYLLGGVFGLGVRDGREALVLGAVLGIVAPLGDLFESMVKRDLGVKDMGSLIPSHGGVLDRFDNYLFTLPAAYYALRILGVL